MKRSEYPLIKCLPRSDFIGGFKFWCPFCKRFHYHGRGEGHRVSHCKNDSKSPYYDSGYFIKRMSKKDLWDIIEGILSIYSEEELKRIKSHIDKKLEIVKMYI